MKVIYSLRDAPTDMRGAVVTVGVFDGVHIGHQKVIRMVVRRARSLKLSSVVVTFDPHPMKVVRPIADVPSIMSLKHRIEVMRQLGIDYLVVLRFTKALSSVPPGEFIEKILIKKLALREIYISSDFCFGKKASGNTRSLQLYASRYNFKIVTVSPICRGNKCVSSSRIRNFITAGEIGAASRLLGRPVSIWGTVVKGSEIGRTLGFSTANIDPHHEAIPPSGVYAVIVRRKKGIYKGVLSIGFRPTIHKKMKSSDPVIEVHLLRLNQDIYGEDLEVLFVKKIREERVFSSIDKLRSRIKKDVLLARRILGGRRLFPPHHQD